jgi:4-diphosphocytidyl-2-C-methyl-D-erythritol kinase
MTAVELPAHAKVNLLLRVLAREDDGFHGLETIFALLDLHDTLSAERVEGSSVTLTVEGGDTGPAAENTVVRAANQVLDATGRRFGLRLHLVKRIPVKSGLGGGSSDGAAALLAANHLAANAVPRHELLQFAARLGSDVAFFVAQAPLALGWGHGERLLRLPALPAAPALLITPAVGVGTAEAYGWVSAARKQDGRRGALALDLDSLSSWGSIGRMAGNDFEAAVFARLPAVRAAFEALCTTHPLVCRMSGSGSTLFAIYRSARERDDAMMMLGPKHGEVRAASTMSAPPPGPAPVPPTGS